MATGRPARTQCKSIYRIGDDGKTAHPHEEFEDLTFTDQETLEVDYFREQRSAKKTRRTRTPSSVEAPPPSTVSPSSLPSYTLPQTLIMPFDRHYLEGTGTPVAAQAGTANAGATSLPRAAFTIAGGSISHFASATQHAPFDTAPPDNRVQIISPSQVQQQPSYSPVQWQHQQLPPTQQGTMAQLRAAAESIADDHLDNYATQHDQQWRSQGMGIMTQRLHPQYAPHYSRQLAQFTYPQGQPHLQPHLQPVQQSQQQQIAYVRATQLSSLPPELQMRPIQAAQQRPPKLTQPVQQQHQPRYILPRPSPPQPQPQPQCQPQAAGADVAATSTAPMAPLSLAEFLGLGLDFVHLPERVHLAIASHLALKDVLAVSVASRVLLRSYSHSVVQVYVRGPSDVEPHTIGRTSKDARWEYFIKNLLARFPKLRRVVTTDHRCLDGLTSLLNSDACPSLLDVTIADVWTLPLHRSALRNLAALPKGPADGTIQQPRAIDFLAINTAYLTPFDLQELLNTRVAPKHLHLIIASMAHAAALASFLRCVKAAPLRTLKIDARIAGPTPLDGRASLLVPVIEALLCGRAASLTVFDITAFRFPSNGAFPIADSYGDNSARFPLITHPEALRRLKRIAVHQTVADDTTSFLMTTLFNPACKYPDLQEVSIDSYQGLSAKTISALSDALFRHSLPALETLRLVAYVDPDRLDARPDLGNLRIDTLVTALASGRCDAMKRLSLKSCNVTRLATSSLMHAIMQGRCPLLEHLDLSYNNLGDEGLHTIIIHGLPNLPNLRELHLNHIKATVQGAHLLSQALRQGAVPRLCLLRLYGWEAVALPILHQAVHLCGRQNIVRIDAEQMQ